MRRSALQDHILNLIVDDQHLIDSCSALITGVHAVKAAFALHEIGIAFIIDSPGLQHLR